MDCQKNSILRILFFVLSLICIKMAEGFKYDYCSVRHSYQVLQEIRGEIVPLLEKYSIQLDRDRCPIFDSEILSTHFHLHYNTSLNEHRLSSMTECSRCGKKFNSRDYLEFHWKHKHVDVDANSQFPSAHIYEGLYPPVPQELIGKADGICLADYCDIFECKDFPDMSIKHTTFSQRNYERSNIPKGEVSEEQINYMKRANRQMTKYLDKYEIDDVLEEGEKENTILFNPKWYSDFQKSMLLEKCVTLLSNCLIQSDSPIINDEKQKFKLMAAYDILYSNYCKKFEVKEKIAGIDAGPTFETKFYMIEESAKAQELINSKGIWYSLKIIAIVLSCVGTVLYYLGVYLVKYETDEV